MTEKTTGFDALLEDLGALSVDADTLTKALPAAPEGDTGEADEKIAAAAEEGDEEKKEGDEDEAPLGKSFELVLEDGSKVQAIDGAELVKSLIARIEANEAGTKAVIEAAAGVARKQGDLIKSLTAEVTTLRAAGRGRTTVLTIAEKASAAPEVLAKSETPDGLTGEEFMAKALLAQTAGKISGREVAEAESFINSGQTPPPAIVRAVLG